MRGRPVRRPPVHCPGAPSGLPHQVHSGQAQGGQAFAGTQWQLLICRPQVTSVAAPFTAADHAAVCSLVADFGADVLKRSLLVFSHGDVLAADGATLAEYLADAPPDLQVCACRRSIVARVQLAVPTAQALCDIPLTGQLQP